LEKFDNRFSLSKQLKKHWAPRQRYTQEASMESVSLRWLVGGARGPLRRGTQLEKIDQIGLKPTLLLHAFHIKSALNWESP